MGETDDFADLIRRVRDGDPAAATELVRRYEPAIRRAVRFRLGGAGLGGLLDSTDVCQQVLCSFFTRAASGQFQLSTPEDLVRLLVSMARNKLNSQTRRETADRRDRRRLFHVADAGGGLPCPDPGPGREVEARELLGEVFRRLQPEERGLLEMRNEGLDWAAIAERLHDNPATLRKRLSRALGRVARELELDEQYVG